MRKNQRYSEIGERLKTIRGARSQQEFARLLRISKPALQNYEAGLRMPPGDALMKAAELSGTTVDWILCGRESGAGRPGMFVNEDSPEFEILKAVRAMPKSRMWIVRMILRAMLEKEK